MGHLLYLDGAYGISGDMTAAALLALGADRKKLSDALQSLALDDWDYQISSRKSYGFAGLDFDVRVTEHHDHATDACAHAHAHRNLQDVFHIIDGGAMSENARSSAKKIFRIVAEAEAEAHGCPLDEVHFHEVGALDSIVDIVAVAVCLDDLNISECVISGFSEGSGFVHCQHGELPVPVPAVLNIARRFAIPLRPCGRRGEMVTPTGIAIAAFVRTRDKLPEEYRVLQTGIGLGKRDFGGANFLRAMLLQETRDPEQMYMIECNIDDATGEMLALSMDALQKIGARDVHFVPCFMKKNRPAYLLRILASEDLLPELEDAVFRTTTTIGLRKFPVERTCLERKIMTVKLPCGTVEVKCSSAPGLIRCSPEFESVRDLAAQTGIDFSVIYEQARSLALAEWGEK